MKSLDYISDISGGLSCIKDLEVAGSKEGKYGVAIIVSKDSQAAGVFTSNKVVAAPVKYTKKMLKNGIVSAIFVNSGNANCFTGQQGIEDCEELVKLVSKDLKIPESEIAIASTGVIGREMPMDIIEKVAYETLSKLDDTPESSLEAAKAIMTTDTVPKEFAVEIALENNETVRIGGITKGVGMIAPNMGTMLCFLVTDAVMDHKYIKKALKKAVDDSFNMIVVDGDESTNDTTLLLANGASGVEVVEDGKINERFQKGLDYICKVLAKKQVRDGEGASKIIEATVSGAKSKDDARRAAKSIISSALVKSAVFGADPNWGRIAAAVGYAGIDMDETVISIGLANDEDSVFMVREGNILALDDTPELRQAEEIMKSERIFINVDLHLGDCSATAWGCDLTYDYVKINAEYTT
ncbi:MAG: bifunctional ornithine acetyltransferase/N-acetylglutamate synthase [Methanobrevibacter sp.]|uniref:bifunctional ornithine acetyltransferase/N-acetylglutamate synthase n=1 Tax=Methanobrevibacter sp. TaxID=66852 RepID=UPI0026DF80F3|nr:bifunctional ornithine acetyltransferase/N-acetylglutamate synthase [Methanobrevibacter sp.]MDO5848340.1 bifunctional ornithine acetyltransferase/N-acetylglutamate synthase [Methanobrevibacter sp.]